MDNMFFLKHVPTYVDINTGEEIPSSEYIDIYSDKGIVIGWYNPKRKLCICCDDAAEMYDDVTLVQAQELCKATILFLETISAILE